MNKNNEPLWLSFSIKGNLALPESGIIETINSTNLHPQCRFRKDTVILGHDEYNSDTVASWEISIDSLDNLKRGYLVISCIDDFGGLHTMNMGASVEIFFNDNYIQKFSLNIIPENHNDYFHRQIDINKEITDLIFDLEPFKYNKTNYAWFIHKEYFNLTSKKQKITIKIDKKVNWDIDSVSIVCLIEKMLESQSMKETSNMTNINIHNSTITQNMVVNQNNENYTISPVELIDTLKRYNDITQEQLNQLIALLNELINSNKLENDKRLKELLDESQYMPKNQKWDKIRNFLIDTTNITVILTNLPTLHKFIQSLINMPKP